MSQRDEAIIDTRTRGEVNGLLDWILVSPINYLNTEKQILQSKPEHHLWTETANLLIKSNVKYQTRKILLLYFFFLNEENKGEIIYILEDQGVCLTIKPCMVYTNLWCSHDPQSLQHTDVILKVREDVSTKKSVQRWK